jgi:hypothetical protein
MKIDPELHQAEKWKVDLSGFSELSGGFNSVITSTGKWVLTSARANGSTGRDNQVVLVDVAFGTALYCQLPNPDNDHLLGTVFKQ